jgi:type I restriction enzyme S subunit
MSRKTKTTATNEEATPALVPTLRFPEFREAKGWKLVTLGEASVPVAERVGQRKLTPVSISAGIGFVPQSEKFGRDISGNQYQLYTLVRDGDFVFNKGNSLKFPQGCVYLLQGWGEVAAPNVFICFRLKDGYSNGFFQNCFEQNQHGRQLKRHITSGARSNGLLNISKETFFGVEIPTPSLAEQQKIAECLSSVDERIAAQARKLDALKTHKKGLMQQLFPREGETQPRLRFPEFQEGGEWVEEKLDHLLRFQDGFAFKSTDFVKSKEDTTQVIRITDINNQNTNADKVYIPIAFIEADKMGKYCVDDGDLLLSLTGAAGFNFFFWDGGPATINQRTAKVTVKKKSNHALLRLLEPLIHEKINARGEGQNNNLSKEFLSSIVLFIPEPDEQQRIADCLTSLDDLIVAQTQTLEALKTHKRGLMQQLFPSPEEVEA